MSPAVVVLIKLAIRLVVFGLVFFLAARKNPKVVIHNKWATPLIALVFALLNTGVYWLLRPILDVATLGVFGFAMPLVINILFLIATVKVFAALNAKRVARAQAHARQPETDKAGKAAVPAVAPAPAPKPWLEISGIMATLWMAAFLTLAHGALYVGVDYLPKQF